MASAAVVQPRSDPGVLRLDRDDLIRTQAYIGGRWIDATDGRVFPVLNPADGMLIAEVADADGAMAKSAVDAAAEAFPGWRSAMARTRSRLLRAWYDLVMRHKEDLARLLSWEQGKPLAEARAELDYASGYIEWFSEEAVRSYGDIIPPPVAGRALFAVKEPIGVAAVITPWNFPAAMITRKFAPALAAGCTTVAKPAGETPLSALALIALAEEAGIPPGVLNIVATRRTREISEAWLADSRVRKISFTGSTAVGKHLMRESAGTMKRLSLELGGDAPLIVFADADRATALKGLMNAKFRNAGQSCIGANRIMVEKAIYEDFATAAAAAVAQLTLGAATAVPANIGPLIHAGAVREMQEFVDDAVAHGARVLTGGKVSDQGGAYFEPTVLVDVKPGMRLSCSEIFGPIIAISSFRSEEEAIERANATEFGLAAYLFSTDADRIARVSSQLECGVLGINEGLISSEVAPFGGVKESGFGREGSKYGIADYQNIKYICQGMG